MARTVPLRARPSRAGTPAKAKWTRIIELDDETAARYIDIATEELARDHPDVSCKTTFTRRQKIGAGVVVGVLLILAIIFPIGIARLIAGTLTLVYAAAVIYRVRAFRLGLRGGGIVQVTEEDARAFDADALPVYTVLVPAYREPEVIGEFLGHLENLDYPEHKLEILVLLEADDDETLEAVVKADPGESVRVVVVPPGEVQTKPRACNYGLLLATGELLTIYDAEDDPEPLQLRRSAIAFGRLPRRVACLQARLAYFNTDQNIITRWFSAEYLTWFNHFLPGLTALRGPIPLGGTSNHVRTDVLREVGGWDPYNVTEDADLGMRLARRGYQVDNLDSVTYEEANSDFINWVKQRSRWYKGYLQTWLVHMRHPRQVKREIGWRGLAGLNMFIGGTPLLAALNPIFWGMALLWFAFHPGVIEKAFGGPIYFVAMGCWIFGNLAIVYLGLLSMRAVNRPDLGPSALIVPAYWAMMALAATKAMIQLIVTPSLWEKTTHGLSVRTGHGHVTDPAAPSDATAA